MLHILALTLLVLAGAAEAFPGKRFDFQSDSGESRVRLAALTLRYRVTCGGAPGEIPALHGTATHAGNQLRFELPRGRGEARVGLGTARGALPAIPIALDPHPSCNLTFLEVEESGRVYADLDATTRQVLANIPFVAVRADQLGNRDTDYPLALGYSLIAADGGGVRIRYTLFLTDEDSQRSTRSTEAQATRYGRKTDIEWVYEVDLSPDRAQVIARRYHGDLFAGIGHKTHDFRGGYLTDSAHPILYDIAKHNVFGDRPAKGQGAVGYLFALDPARDAIPSPEARETFQFARPWMFELCDAELAREKKLGTRYTDYLYVLVDGALEGSVTGVIRRDDGGSVRSGGGSGSLDRLGEDLWGRQAYTALPLGASSLATLGRDWHGEFGWDAVGSTRLDGRAIRFYRFATEKPGAPLEDLSARFRCPVPFDAASRCRF